MELEQKELAKMFAGGLLTKAFVVPAPLAEKGYNVLIENAKKSKIMLVTARGEPRNFKTIQVAINVIQIIGFKKLEVNL